MNKSYKILGLQIILGILVANSLMAETAKMTLRVEDDDGKPIAGYPVNAGTYEGANFEGTTDTNGFFVMEGKAVHYEINWMLKNEGYYRSHGKYEFKAGVKDGKWQPWNPVVTTVVRRIANPVAMYAKRVETNVPAENTVLGFDLTMGDWVSPYGSGQTSDFLFLFTKRISGRNDFEGGLSLSFLNTFDGIVENRERYAMSVFHLPRYTSEAGYQTNWCVRIAEDANTKRHGDLEVFSGGNPEKSYFFRTRSKKDVNGNFLEANYGKIDGEIRVIGVARPGSEIMFTYYLNPTPNDRNMEFDPKRNLLQNLKSTEEVRAP